ncbi:MAG: hypothetical protein QOE94_1573 [Mycobacterium sp.]|nr:hypothetical protein [Mycobacterium sp.]
MARVGLAVRDRAGLVTPGDPAARDPVDQAGRAARDLADLAARDLAGRVGLVGRVGLEDMNRVAPGVLEDIGPADPADLAALASRGVRGQVGLEDMDPADLAGLGLGVPNRAALAAPEDLDLGVRNQAGRRRVDRGLRALDPEGREARDLSLGRALLGRTPTDLDRALLDRTPADPDRARLGRMPARLDRTPAGLDRTRRADRTHPADRLWEPMTRVEATRPEARMRLAEVTRLAEATRVEATRRAGATRRAEATHLAERTQPGELIAKAIGPLTPHKCMSATGQRSRQAASQRYCACA